MEPSSITENLNRSLQYNPAAYWCPRCWKWRLDCSHLVEPLDRPHVKLNDSIHVSAAYDRQRRILEVRMNTGEGFQYQGVSLQLAREFAKSTTPAEFLKERLPRAKFERVRGEASMSAELAWNLILQEVADRQTKALESGRRLWFRGQSRSEWVLASRLHRHIDEFFSYLVAPAADSERRMMVHAEGKSLYRKFREDAWPLLTSEGREPWGTLFAMQHYGIPTRLLDWTESFPCAIYFANKDRKPGTEAAFYMLDPEGLNEMSGIEGLLTPADTPGNFDLNSYHPHWVPNDTAGLSSVAVAPAFEDPRMRAQRAAFVLAGESFLPIEEQHDGKLSAAGIIQKIALPAEVHEVSVKWLQLTGISNFTFFPDMEGIKLDFEARRSYQLQMVAATKSTPRDVKKKAAPEK